MLGLSRLDQRLIHRLGFRLRSFLGLTGGLCLGLRLRGFLSLTRGFRFGFRLRGFLSLTCSFRFGFLDRAGGRSRREPSPQFFPRLTG